jgi:hypothetical protein
MEGKETCDQIVELGLPVLGLALNPFLLEILARAERSQRPLSWLPSMAREAEGGEERRGRETCDRLQGREARKLTGAARTVRHGKDQGSGQTTRDHLRTRTDAERETNDLLWVKRLQE